MDEIERALWMLDLVMPDELVIALGQQHQMETRLRPPRRVTKARLEELKQEAREWWPK